MANDITNEVRFTNSIDVCAIVEPGDRIPHGLRGEAVACWSHDQYRSPWAKIRDHFERFERYRGGYNVSGSFFSDCV